MGTSNYYSELLDTLPNFLDTVPNFHPYFAFIISTPVSVRPNSFLHFCFLKRRAIVSSCHPLHLLGHINYGGTSVTSDISIAKIVLENVVLRIFVDADFTFTPVTGGYMFQSPITRVYYSALM